LSADEAAISDTPAARATSRSVGASLRRRVFGGVGGGFGFDVGTDVPGRRSAAGRVAQRRTVAPAFVRGGARHRPRRALGNQQDHQRPLLKPNLYSTALGQHTKLPLGVLVQLNRRCNPDRSSVLGDWSMPRQTSSITSRALH